MEMLHTYLGENGSMHAFKHHFRLISGPRLMCCLLTGCHHFPYLLNVVCKNEFTHCYMACGRVLINHQDGISIGNTLSKLECNVRSQHKDYKIGEKHKEILLDFDDAEANGFMQAFGKEIINIIIYVDAQFIFSDQLYVWKS